MSGSFYALDELKEAGADICFAKPFHIDEIEKAIENLLPNYDISTGINDSCRLY
jgi:DNA-binding response OmpR family regulator